MHYYLLTIQALILYIVDMTSLRMNELPDVMTVTEAAAVMRVSALTLKRMCRKNLVKHFRIGLRKDRRFLKSDIINYLDKCKTDEKIDS